MRGAGGRLHLTATLFLLVSLFAPVALAGAAAPAPVPQPTATGAFQDGADAPPPFPAPTAAALEGDFQVALGCPADFDPTCPVTQLAEHRGVFTAALPVPQGNYEFRVVTQSPDGIRSLGEDADPDGDNIELTVPGNAAGVHFSYHYRTGEIVAEPYTERVTIQGEFGTFDARPIQGGDYEVFFSTPAGAYTLQPLVNGAPAGTPQPVNLEFNARVHVVLDGEGNVQVLETVPQAGLTVVKTDQGNPPQPQLGSCFALFDGDDLATQACDVDDGEDGVTFLLFLNGIEGGGGTFELRETLVPDGQDAVEEQDVTLNDGEFNELAVAGTAGEEPGPGPDEGEPEPGPEETEEVEPGPGPDEGGVSVTLVAVDAATQQPLPGACYQPEGGEEVCDGEDGSEDGETTLTGLPAGAQIAVTETEAPEGGENVGTFGIQVAAGARFGVPHPPSAEPEPAPDEPGTIVILIVDEDGDAIRGGSYTVTNAFGEFGPFEDDNQPGRIEVTQVPPGESAVAEFAPPDGYLNTGQTVQTVTVDPGEEETVTFTYAEEEEDVEPADTEEAQPGGDLGTVIVEARDEAGNLIVPGGCYAGQNAIGPYGPECDDDEGPEDGRVEFGNLGPGQQEIAQVEPPAGYVLVGDDEQDVQVGAGQTETVVFTYAPADDQEPAPDAEPGTLEIEVTDQDGDPLPGACFLFTPLDVTPGEPVEICDDDDGADDGTVTATLPAGAYQVEDVVPPAGAEQLGSGNVQIQAGATDEQIVEYQVEAPPPEPEPEDEPGTLTIRAEDDEGTLIPAGCYTVTNAAGTFPDPATDPDGFCDEDGDGRIALTEVVPGDNTVREVRAPGGDVGAAEATEQTVDIDPGEDETVTFVYPAEEPAPQTGTLRYIRTDEDGNLVGGACILLEGQVTVGPVCDNQRGADVDPDAGEIEIQDLPPDSYLVSEPTPPEGYEAPDPDFATIDPGETETYEAATAAPPETADLVVLVGDGQGNAVGGTCFELLDPETGEVVVEEVCDEDGDRPDDGRVGFIGIPVRGYVLHQTRTNPAFEAAPDQPVDVPAAGLEFPVTNAPIPPETGDLQITRLNQEGEEVGGGCYQVTDEEGQTLAEGCDNDPAVDADDDEGQVEFEELPEGPVTVAEIQAPEGLVQADPQPAAIEPDETEPVEIQTGPALITLTINAVDENGEPLGLVCYRVENAAGRFEPFCDEENGAGDGQVILDVYPGNNTITVIAKPDEYATPAAQSLPVAPGQENQVTFEFVPATGAVEITKTEENGDPLGGACFSLQGAQTYGPVCDDDENDANDDEGVIRFENVLTGDYQAVEEQSPAGYQQAPNQPVTVVADETAPLTVQNVPSGGIVEAVVQEEGGAPIDGACVTLQGPQTYGPVCDNDGNDQDDTEGVIRFENVAPGTYNVLQDPTAQGLAPAEVPAPIDVVAGEVETVIITNAPPAPETGAVQILKTGEGDQPLGGACFVLDGEGDNDYGPACDDRQGDGRRDVAGTILIEDVAPGTYQVVEETVPDGYDPPQAIEPVTVVASETATVSVANQPEAAETGSLQITKVDAETDELLGGACFGLSGPIEVASVCDGSRADGNPDETGVILITDLVPGTYTPTETQAPGGYVAAGTIADVTVAGGDEPATITVENSQAPPPIGSVLVRTEDPDGTLVPGACYRVTGADGAVLDLCDGTPSDPATEIGQVRFDGIVEGQATVAELSPPPGYQAAEPATQTVPVVAEDVAAVTFTNAPVETEGQTGGLLLELRAQDGDPTTTEEQFFLRRYEGTEEIVLGPFQDNGEGDGDNRQGFVLLEDVPVGSWSVYQPQEQQVLAEGFAPAGLADFQEKTVTVQANVVIVVIIIIIIIEPDEGDFLVTKRAGSEVGSRLAGSCFRLESLDDPPTAFGVCDDDFADVDAIDPTLTPLSDTDQTDGRLRFDDVPAGDYTLIELQAPAGYTGGGAQEVEVVGGGLRSITIVNTPIPNPVGDLIVHKVDAEGDNPIEGACFELRNPAGTEVLVPQICDGDGNDGDGASNGQIVFADRAAIQYRLRETVAPQGYLKGADRLVTVVADDDVEVTVINTLQFGTVIVEKRALEEDGDLLVNACFRLDGQGDAPDYAELCDADDGLPADGRTVFAGVQPGSYTAVETETPAGYDDDDPQPFTLNPGQQLTLVFVNELLPPPPATGNLVVHKVDERGQPLPGACFTLRQGAVTVRGPVCDSADGSSDGTIRFDNVVATTLTLRESKKPSADYQTVADQEVTIRANRTTTVEVENVLRPGRVLIRKTNTHGQPLQGACFDVAPDGKGARCTNAEGEVLFEGLTPGTYRVTETVPPPGYAQAPQVRNVLVRPGATTIVTIVDQPLPPPPDTGSVRIIKFYCPAGTGGEFTQIFDSSDAGGAQLAQTAGCDPGDAEFTLLRAGGEGGPGTISTGNDGTFQTTLAAGAYRLTEIDPQLGEAADRTEQLIVSRNQQTTIVVINYVAPPPPAPVDIVVIKYTCDPGLSGTLYADFLANCGDRSQLTNGVTFRISGQATGKAVTGDRGEKGVTGFHGLPAGAYTLKEEPPAFTTVHVFCGLDVNNPTLSAVGNQIEFTLKPGQRISCVFFNVPAEVTDTTGAILVHKLTCPIQTPPAGYDFEGNCRTQQASAQFSLAYYNGELRRFEPKATGATNANGLLQFSRLQAGTYELKEIGTDWCFAESNSVNAQGNVLVRANQLAEVWIYNCNPTKGPPNTGAGTTAGLGAAVAGGAGATSLALGLAWPLLGLAGWRLRQGRRRAA